MLTKRRKEVLDFMKTYLKKNGYSPSLQEIQKKLKLASVSTAHFHVSKLQDGGYITKQSGRARGIEANSMGTMVRIPLLGYIAAGEPIEVLERSRETIVIQKSRFSKSDEMYALRVQGDSMIDEGVNDGDTILINKQNTAENGDKVVALLNGNEATLKTFYKEKGHIRLQPANKNYEPIIIKKIRAVKILGIVFGIFRCQ